MSTSSQLRLNNPKEFRQLFESMITPETRVRSESAINKSIEMLIMKILIVVENYSNQYFILAMHWKKRILTGFVMFSLSGIQS